MDQALSHDRDELEIRPLPVGQGAAAQSVGRHVDANRSVAGGEVQKAYSEAERAVGSTGFHPAAIAEIDVDEMGPAADQRRAQRLGKGGSGAGGEKHG